MRPVRVDENRGIRLEALSPGDVYQPEILSRDEIRLRRVESSVAKPATREQALADMDRVEIKLRTNWDGLKRETRE
jgi:hypothetical protein